MTYGLSPQLFVENGPAVQAARSVAARRPSSGFLAWRNLDAERRLALIEDALAGAANDNRDGYPAAL